MLSQYTGINAQIPSADSLSQRGARICRISCWLYPMTSAASSACTKI